MSTFFNKNIWFERVAGIEEEACLHHAVAIATLK
jgi:hypothetical protein